ncbi:hypothetical protein Sdagh_51970 [Streptomyces daghestanicus]|uniref:Uncharacterized protein n=1 Tax=Streptomyces daghestanicus TaxID=66885 RepID=A0ABQ3Q896_9ACTN|nr:hypothetical protein Sdagh_51970 [Streptomyces daghestanicus]
MESREGTTLATVTPVSWIIRASAAGSARSSVRAMARVPPAARVTARSSTDASKLNDANCRVVSPGPAPRIGVIASTRSATARCVTATPFGRPVEPEV